MITKEELKQYIRKLPQETSITELINYLVKVEKLKNGIGNATSEEEIRLEIQQMIRELN